MEKLLRSCREALLETAQAVNCTLLFTEAHELSHIWIICNHSALLWVWPAHQPAEFRPQGPLGSRLSDHIHGIKKDRGLILKLTSDVPIFLQRA